MTTYLPLILLLVLFPAAMAYAAATDLFSMTISNKLCLGLVLGFVVTAAILGLTWSQIGWHLAAGGIVLLVSFGMFAAGWIGGGDAKLVSATALWFGFGELLPYLAVAGVAGGALTFMILAYRRYPMPALVERWPWARRLHAATEGVPYGIALSFSALTILPETGIWRAAIGI